MVLPPFNEYTARNPLTEQHRKMNESELYALYIQWVIDQQATEATVNELLFQLQAISCYVQQQGQMKIASELNHNAINQSVYTLFSTMAPHIPLEGFKDLSSVYFTMTAVASGISALFIGAAFAPQLPIGGAIALWTIGALFGSLALYILKEYNNDRVEKNTFNQAENNALAIATKEIAPIVRPTPTPGINNAVTCTLKAALYTNIFELEKHKIDKPAEIRLDTLSQFLTPRV